MTIKSFLGEYYKISLHMLIVGATSPEKGWISEDSYLQQNSEFCHSWSTSYYQKFKSPQDSDPVNTFLFGLVLLLKH